MSDVPLKDYLDALNDERRRTGNMRAIAIVGTFGALIFSIQQAVKVYASSNANLFSLHNDLIRKGEREAAIIKGEMATKIEVEPLKTFKDQQMGGQVSMGRVWGAVGIAVPIALFAGGIIAKLLGV